MFAARTFDRWTDPRGPDNKAYNQRKLVCAVCVSAVLCGVLRVVCVSVRSQSIRVVGGTRVVDIRVVGALCVVVHCASSIHYA